MRFSSKDSDALQFRSNRNRVVQKKGAQVVIDTAWKEHKENSNSRHSRKLKKSGVSTSRRNQKFAVKSGSSTHELKNKRNQLALDFRGGKRGSLTNLGDVAYRGKDNGLVINRGNGVHKGSYLELVSHRPR